MQGADESRMASLTIGRLYQRGAESIRRAPTLSPKPVLSGQATSRIVGKRTVGVADLNFDRVFGQVRTKGILGALLSDFHPMSRFREPGLVVPGSRSHLRVAQFQRLRCRTVDRGLHMRRIFYGLDLTLIATKVRYDCRRILQSPIDAANPHH